MKIIFFLLALCCTTFSMAQKYYIKTYSPFNLEYKGITDMCLQGKDVVFRAGGFLPTGQEDTVMIGRFSTSQDSMIQIEKLEKVESGFSIIESDGQYILSSNKAIDLKSMSLSVVDKALKVQKTITLQLPNNRYFDYIVREAIQFGNKSIVSAELLDTLNQYKWNGQYQCRQKLALFVVDKQLKLDTSFLIAPSNNSYWMQINGLGVFSDSILYVSIYDRGPGFERRAIYGYNKQFKKVFSWIGPDIHSYLAARSSLAVDKDNTIYTAYYAYNSRTYLYAIDSGGKKKWECPFDSAMITGGWNDFNLMIAKDGNILGSALRESAMSDLGQCTYIFKISPQGKMLWQRILRINKGFNTYAGAEDFGLSLLPSKILELPNNDIIVGGRYSNFLGKDFPGGPNNKDLFIARVDSTGCLWKNCPYIQDVVQKPKYLPIVTARNEWVTYNAVSSAGEPFNTFSGTFTSDSFLLDNKYYFKKRSKSNNWGATNWSNGTSYYREQNGIVYYKSSASVPEKIMYNFNLGVGDTLPSLGNNPKSNRTIKSVSTVTYSDGIPRKKMTFLEKCDMIVVEGLGDLYGNSLSNCTGLEDFWTTLRCFSTDGKLVYKNPSIQACYTILTVKDIDARISNIYPNPSAGLLNIDIEDAQSIKNIFVTDNLGRIMNINEHIYTDSGIQLNISNLQNGLYFGSVAFSDGSKTGFKITKVSE